jgi:hypothetical protein
MPSITDVWVSVMPDTSRLASGIQRAFREVDSDAAEAGRRWGREIEGGLGDVKVDLKADTARAKAELDEAARDRDSTVHVDVDRDNLSQIGTTVVRTLVPQFANAGQQAGNTFASSLQGTLSTPGIGPAVTALIAASIVPAMVDLGGVAASASQSLLLLPGAAGAAASAFGTLKLATMGFSDALGAIGDPDKFAEQLQSLSPAAQQAALAIQAMMPAFTALKTATQDALFTGVGGMLNGLVNQYLPTIQQATTGIAAAFNTMLGGVANQLMTPQTQAAIQSFLANVTQAFQNLAPAAAPFTQAITTLMSAGSGVLPQIAQAATQAAFAFSDFITKASQSGDLQRWLADGLTTLKQLGQIAWDVGRAFLSLAPAGQDILPGIVTAVNNIANAMPTLVSWVQGAQNAFLTWFPRIAPVITPLVALIDNFSGGLERISSIAGAVANAVSSAFGVVRQVIDAALQPIREAINIANKLPGVNIPNIPVVSGNGGTTLSTPTSLPGRAPGTYRRRDGSVGTVPAPAIPLPTANLPTIPIGGYAVPLPPPPKTTGGSSATTTPDLPFSYSSAAAPYPGDAALLANVPAGSYTNSGTDLVKGLGDCSSAVGDLVKLLDGEMTGGANRLNTGNAAQWLVDHGFLPGMGGPGDFRVGYNAGHMQATLPDGTAFNWGSNAAAARGGVGGTGADDPSFTSHYYRPMGAAPSMAGLSPSMGLTSSDLTLRNAQQRVSDTQADIEEAQGRLDELNAKGTATQRQRAEAERAVAVAKREHADAVDALTVATNKYNESSSKTKDGDSGMSGLGQDFMSGIMQVFGFDGSLFKSPADFGLMKFLSGAANLKMSDQGGAGGTMPGGGGGNILGGLLQGVLPQAVGALKSGSPADAPGEFMPSMPGSGGGGINIPALATSGATGAPGPGNQIGHQGDVYNITAPDPNNVAGQFKTDVSIPKMRQGLRNVPS